MTQILIVEDNDALAENMSELLEGLGTGVVLVADADAALAAAGRAIGDPRLVAHAVHGPSGFHFHMAEGRKLMVEYLDAVGLAHNEGVLDLPEDAEAPTAEAAAGPARDLVAKHGREALVYLGTLAVADADFWDGMIPVLEGWGEDGEAIA